MKSLLKLAMGAAIAGALVQVLLKQRGRGQTPGDESVHDGIPAEAHAPQQADQAFPTELVADTSSVGEGSGDDRVQLPDDGRVGQGPLNS
jgi:hypothetical protein